ncbi:MAG: hypothetical protein RR627_11060, partial [Niameybacter sp.]
NGIFTISDVAANTTAACLDQIHKGLLNLKKEIDLTQKYIHDFRTQVTGQDQLVGALSGATLLGIPVKETKWMSFVLCGMLVAIGGVLYVSHCSLCHGRH